MRSTFRALANGPKIIRPPSTNLPPDTKVCVLGVGYVGESLMSHFGKHVPTIGYDISESRISALITKYHTSKLITLTTDAAHLASGTYFLIAVPTPLRPADNSVDLSIVIKAFDIVLSIAQPGSTIVIESSVPVGTTRRLLGPHKHLFHGGMSPERIDPGRLSPKAEQIPKIISGLTPAALRNIFALYSLVYETLVPVSKPEVAEMTKLYENCYRMVNVAYVNEISDACLDHGIDPQEMIGAAATKPFGFQPFYPGLGVGGHCIPINPWYLFENNKGLKVLDLATKMMADRPGRLARRVYRDVSAKIAKDKGTKDGQVERKPRVLIVGLGFKNGQTNLFASPALSFAKEMREVGCARLSFYDPGISGEQAEFMEKLGDECWSAAYIEKEFDAVVLCNRMDAIDVDIIDKLRRPLIERFS